LIVSSKIQIFYVSSSNSNFLAQEILNVVQNDGQNPYTHLTYKVNEAVVDPLVFTEYNGTLKKAKMIAGKSFTTPIELYPGFEKRNITFAFENSDKTGRLTIEGTINYDEKTLTIPYVPSVFKSGININLIAECLEDGYGFTATLPIDYVNLQFTTNSKQPVFYYPTTDTVIHTSDKDLEVTWGMGLDTVSEDGYSKYVCLSIIAPESKRILRRTFVPNTGHAIFENAVPANAEFLLILSSSSSKDYAFNTIEQNLHLQISNGTYISNKTPFSTGNLSLMIVSFACLFILVIVKLSLIIRAKMLKKREKNKENQALLSRETLEPSSDGELLNLEERNETI